MVWRNGIFSLFLLMTVSFSTLVAAKADSFEANWKPWVEARHQKIACAWEQGKKSTRFCYWLGELSLDMSERHLDFSFTAEILAANSVLALPGDKTSWPAQVLVNGKAARVLERSGKPYLSLDAGKYSVTGRFNWQRRPSSLLVPDNFVLLSLISSGKAQTVNRQRGKLFFDRQKDTRLAQSTDSLTVDVYRYLQDAVPLRLQTQLKVSVSGKAREVNLGQVLANNLEVININTVLPLRIEGDGNMRVQIKPGVYTITIWARFIDNPEKITMNKGENWPEYEYLSFQADTDIRQVVLSGATSIDTSQVAIPEQWQNLPTYRLDQNTILNIVTKERGDMAPAENSLSINRQLWLDFDGSSVTALDKINGRMSKTWRLNTQQDTLLGRAEVAGQPVLITEHNNMQGVEIRSPEIELDAVSRIQSPQQFSSIGWQADVDKFSARMHLPPGWRVLFVGGAESANGAWLERWDLWDIFLVLIIIAASYKLMGIKIAALASISLLLGYHESGFPLFLWPALLLLVALLPVLKNRLLAFFSIASVGLTALLWVLIIGFAITAFRLAIYPSLEQHGVANQHTYSMVEQSMQDDSFEEAEIMTSAALEAVSMDRSMKSEKLYSKGRAPQRKRQNLYAVGEKDRIQTGPGLPTWNWSSIYINATGAVAQNAKFNFVFSPPWMTRLWRIVSVLLLVLWAGLLTLRLYRLVDLKASSTSEHPNTGVAKALALFPLAMIFSLALQSTPANAQTYPPEYLLKELEEKLLKAPKCLPNCASQNNGRLSVDKGKLSLSFEVYADADIALALPKANWQNMQIDNKSILLRHKQGQPFALVTKGHHQIKLQAKINGDQLTLSFPLAIHNFVVDAPQWQVDGLVDGRVLSNTLNLSAKAKVKNQEQNILTPKPAKPFVLVHRQLILEKQWQLVTSVERIAPSKGAIVINIPLLAGEKVLSSEPVSDGLITVQIPANQYRMSWRSTLKPVNQLVWKAADRPDMLETWQIKPSSLWRVSSEGLLPVKSSQAIGSLQPLWKPWPNEQLTINIDRPNGIKGPVQTVEDINLEYKSGKLKQKTSLRLNVRSSQGEDYRVGLPDDAKVLSVKLNNKALNLPSGKNVTVQLQPGLQLVEIEFEQSKALSLLSQTPKVKLPDTASNINVQYILPRDRWPLYVTGPAIGPAMLYWGVLCVIVLAAIALHIIAVRTKLNLPVSIFDWLLLGIGLSTVNSYGVIFVAAFFFLLAFRQQRIEPDIAHAGRFNITQVLIVMLTVVTVGILVSAIPMGLLSTPNMKVTGNGSYSYLFNYYQDRAGVDAFPVASIYSVPLSWYRVVMLVWSLWLALRIVRWGAWWWQAFSAKGVWLSAPAKQK